MAAWQVHHKRAEDLLAELPDNSVDLILTDPPYYKVKAAAWDNQWRTTQEFLAWLGSILEQYVRVLKPNGSLYLFASPQMAAHVEVKIGSYLNVLTRITWRKEAGWAKKQRKEDLRQFFPSSEFIIFAEQHGADSMAKGEAGYERKCDELKGFVFEPLRSYFVQEKAKSSLSNAEIEEGMLQLTGKRYVFLRHTFSQSQWELPTREQYEAAQHLFNSRAPECLGQDYSILRERYEVLKRQYDDLKAEYETLRRPFSVTADVPYTDIWDFPTVKPYPGKHECEKPQELLQHIITASSRPGAVVLDTFTGGGSTGEATLTLGRSFIGCDASEHWANYSRDRLAKVAPGEAAEAPRPMAKVIPIKKRETAPSRPEQVRFCFDVAEGTVNP